MTRPETKAATAAVQQLEERRNYTLLSEYRPGRNFIRPGDLVKCKPVTGVSFRATVCEIREYADGVVTIEVLGGPGGHRAFRSFLANRVSRLAQSKHRN
jgi:hypothetical protein